jgi:hypothetical protein
LRKVDGRVNPKEEKQIEKPRQSRSTLRLEYEAMQEKGTVSKVNE